MGKKRGGERVSRGDEAGKQIAQNEVAHYLPADSDSGEDSRGGEGSHRSDGIAEAGLREYRNYSMWTYLYMEERQYSTRS